MNHSDSVCTILSKLSKHLLDQKRKKKATNEYAMEEPIYFISAERVFFLNEKIETETITMLALMTDLYKCYITSLTLFFPNVYRDLWINEICQYFYLGLLTKNCTSTITI